MWQQEVLILPAPTQQEIHRKSIPAGQEILRKSPRKSSVFAGNPLRSSRQIRDILRQAGKEVAE